MSTRRTWPGTPSLLSDLVDERLTDAACVSLAPGFDDLLVGESPQEADERFATAAAVCARCPVWSACSAAADELGDLAVGCVGWPRSSSARHTWAPEEGQHR